MTKDVLDSPPGLLGLYAKAALGALPFRRRQAVGPANAADLRNLSLRLEGVVVEPTRLAAYREVCGFRGGSVPATYPHVLAFPLHLALMTDSTFPFPAVGAVHIGNTIEQHRPLPVGKPVNISVHASALLPHPRGRQITLVSDVDIDGEVLWRERTVLLHREKPVGERVTTDRANASTAASDVAVAVPSQESRVPPQPPTGPLVWKLSSALGRRYAAVSGDRNPIHLYDITARPLGFPRHIAHGMWSLARGLAELSNHVGGDFTVEVAFKKPINLPGAVRFGARENGRNLDFGLSHASTGVPHLLGRISRP